MTVTNKDINFEEKGAAAIVAGAVVVIVALFVAGIYIAPKLLTPTDLSTGVEDQVNSPTPEAKEATADGEVASDAFEYIPEKLGFSVNYPSNYGYAKIDPATITFAEPKPELALQFSKRWPMGEEVPITWQDQRLILEDPILMVYKANSKTAKEWAENVKKRAGEEAIPVKVISESQSSVSGKDAYVVETSTTDDELTSLKTVIFDNNGYIFEFSYYPAYKATTAEAILNSVRFK